MSPASESEPTYGLSDTELLEQETVFRDDLACGTTVLVTGAGSGLGKAIAVLFARLGARLVLVGRDAAKLETTARLIDRTGSESTRQPTNIREPSEVDQLFEKLDAAGIRLDVLVNNAGGQFPAPATEISDRGWRAVVDTNLNGTWTMMQRAARVWQRDERPGSIVNIIAPFERGMYGVAHTVAARAGVAHLSRNLAVEWAPGRIRVNCVLPGPIDTEGMNVYPREAQERMAKGNPMMRLGRAQDIAEACVYLSAPSGRFVTGETLVVDGGHQAWGELWLAGRPAHFDG